MKYQFLGHKRCQDRPQGGSDDPWRLPYARSRGSPSPAPPAIHNKRPVDPDRHNPFGPSPIEPNPIEPSPSSPPPRALPLEPSPSSPPSRSYCSAGSSPSPVSGLRPFDTTPGTLRIPAVAQYGRCAFRQTRNVAAAQQWSTSQRSRFPTAMTAPVLQAAVCRETYTRDSRAHDLRSYSPRRSRRVLRFG